MKTFDLKIYPHKLMIRGNEDEFCAINYAEEVYNIIKIMLDKHKIKYVDESCNNNCTLLIKNPDNIMTKVVVKKILCIFDCVSKRQRYLIS